MTGYTAVTTEKGNNVKTEIIDLIKRKGHVSCVELCQEVAGFSGDRDWFINSNTILWLGVSSEAVSVMNELLDEKEIVGNGSSVLVYLVDGSIPKLPIAKRPNAKYKTPHWWPVTFSTWEQIGRKRPKKAV